MKQSQHTSWLRAAVARVPYDTVVAEMEKPRGGPDSRIRLSLAGFIRLWDVKVGQGLGVRVKHWRWTNDRSELLLELEPLRSKGGGDEQQAGKHQGGRGRRAHA